MYKKVEWLLTEDGKREIELSGGNIELMAGRLLKAINGGSLPYKEIVEGLYEGSPCPHVLVVEKNATGSHISYSDLIGYILYEDNILKVLDIQGYFTVMLWKDIDKVLDGDINAPFILTDAIANDPRSKLSTEKTLV